MVQIKAIPRAHAFLRRATKRLHRRIDRTSVLAILVAPGVTLDLYRTAMHSLEQAYEDIDLFLMQSCELCPAGLPVYTPRLPGIKQDLIALDAFSSKPQRLRAHSRLKMPDNEAAYLGTRYVVEGAQLGSRFIHGSLHAAFGERLQEIGSFWIPGWAPQCSWPGVLRSLDRLQSRESLAAAARAARLTFRHMEQYLTVDETEAP